jgi:hypothetical protein
MASYSDRLRDRLKQISATSDDATTWSQLKAAREKARKASLADVANINAQTAGYAERLRNYRELDKGGYMTGTGPPKKTGRVDPNATKAPVNKPKPKKPTVVTRKHRGQITGKTLW